MSNLQFDDDAIRNNYGRPLQKKGMSDFLVDKGIVKDRKTAEMVLLAFAIILASISVFIVRRNLSDPSPRNSEPNIKAPELDVPFGRS